MSTYDDLKARWAAEKLEGDQVSYEDCVLSHVVSASDFVAELHRLGNATYDLRLVSAAKAVFECGLVDKKGSWRSDFPQSAINYREICEIMAYELVEFWVVQEGLSLRLACARVTVTLCWEGNSFEAATKTWSGSGVNDRGQHVPEISIAP
jgi:hypothetical protein